MAMTICTAVEIRPGQDWCQANNHNGLPNPRAGIYIAGVFVCYECLDETKRAGIVVQMQKDDNKDLLDDLESALSAVEDVESSAGSAAGDLRELLESLREVLA